MMHDVPTLCGPSNQKMVYNCTTDRAAITTPAQSAAITFDDGDGFWEHAHREDNLCARRL